MKLILIAGIGFKMFEGPPILDDDPEAHDVTKKTGLGTSFEFTDHEGHRPKHRYPLVNFPRLVDSHANRYWISGTGV